MVVFDKYLLSLCFLFLGLFSLVQKNVDVGITEGFGTHNFHHYGPNEELLGSVVEYIFQDSNGYVWAATRSGVNKLDGNNIQSYSEEDGLVHYLVRGIEEDRNGTI
ncbi:MAG: hypothetical protein MK078_16515 [Crocinitomicaceae bacterium]|nr:hypothetical protein [Crocinitomicaceae bacterium]